MKQLIKRVMSICCAVALLCGMVPAGVVFAATTTADGFVYEVNNNSATITDYTGSATCRFVNDALQKLN